MPLCASVCENFFRVCGFESDLWRCNNLIDNDDFNSQPKAEAHLFPGAPFKANENVKGRPRDVCTPSIKGAGSTAHLSHVVIVCSLFLLALLGNTH